MATPEALESLRQTAKSLKEIQTNLRPFLKLLQKDENDDEQPRAQAMAAVALTIGTLRYMGARLRGLDQGRKNDALRQELNQMRKVLVAVQAKEKTKKDDDDTEKQKDESESKQDDTKEKKEDDTDKDKKTDSAENKSETKATSEEAATTKKRKSPEKTKRKEKKRRTTR